MIFAHAAHPATDRIDPTFPALANHAIGAICAVRAGATFLPLVFILGRAYLWTLQVMTHHCCEHFDLASDRLNQSKTGWTGGSRVLVDEHFKPSVAPSTALFFRAQTSVKARFDLADRRHLRVAGEPRNLDFMAARWALRPAAGLDSPSERRGARM